jgi:hypothetical protein
MSWPYRSVIHTYWGSSPPNIMLLIKTNEQLYA